MRRRKECELQQRWGHLPGQVDPSPQWQQGRRRWVKIEEGYRRDLRCMWLGSDSAAFSSKNEGLWSENLRGLNNICQHYYHAWDGQEEIR